MVLNLPDEQFGDARAVRDVLFVRAHHFWVVVVPVFDEHCFTEFVSYVKEGLVVVILIQKVSVKKSTYAFMEFSISCPVWGVHVQNVEGIELQIA